MSNTTRRKALRAARRAICAEQRVQCSQSIIETLQALPAYQAASHIAAYCAFDGEVDVAALFPEIWQAQKSLYLPAIVAKDKPLQFVPFYRSSNLIEADFGILRPDAPQAKWVTGEQLDMVIVPLVGFTETAQRLGMGGGFYDRTFAFTRTSQVTALVGVAYECQRDDAIEISVWDVPLSHVVTESAIYPI